MTYRRADSRTPQIFRYIRVDIVTKRDSESAQASSGAASMHFVRLKLEVYTLDGDGQETVLRTVDVPRLFLDSAEKLQMDVRDETEEVNVDFTRRLRTTGDKYLTLKVDDLRLVPTGDEGHLYVVRDA